MHLPSLFTAIVALLCALAVVVMARKNRRQLELSWRHRLRDLAVLAEWVDSTAGTPEFPAPGSVSFYTLHPLARWPADYFPPNERMHGKCPLPEHDLRVVIPATGAGVIWAATCQRCAAHWTGNDAPPPLVVARQIEDKLKAIPPVRR